jgi:hypothetical protein
MVHEELLMATLLVAPMASAQSPAAPRAKPPTSPTTASPKADSDDAVLAHWDTDHNGALSPQEFRIGWLRLQATAKLRRLHEQFEAMDTDKNGCPSALEFARLSLMQRAGKSAPPLTMFDTEKNQCLDFKGYLNFVNFMVKHQRY